MWLSHLPHVIEAIIMSFLPLPAPFVQTSSYFELDYMRTEGWADVTDVRAYGDY